MIVLTISLALLGSVALQDGAQNENTPPPSSTTVSVRTITTTAPPRAGEPTRTVCGWETATGSTMRRRVCREVAATSGLADNETREMLRQMQGLRYGQLPTPRQPGGRPVF